MIRVLVGHVIERLRELPAESVHCVVTSPPYYGLRDYGIEPQVWGGELGCEHEWGPMQRGKRGDLLPADQTTSTGRLGTDDRQGQAGLNGGHFCHCNAWRGSLGLEPTPALYIEHMVAVFRGVKRVLRKDGTLWLNIGDSYGAQQGKGFNTNAREGYTNRATDLAAMQGDLRVGRGSAKPKDLLGIPWMLAFALRDDGWWLRSEITWAKKAPMPESCADRPTAATEKVFLLTKSSRYFYDAEAVKEEAGCPSGRQPNEGGKRNMRNFWLLGPEPFPEAHFATFVTEIPRRAILAGTSERGVCPKCGAGWERIISGAKYSPPSAAIGERNVDISRCDKVRKLDGKSAEWRDAAASRETIGWRATCSCDAGAAVPATCLDPFLGAGTTALVADRLGRHCIGIEINPKYAAMAERRCREEVPLFSEIAAE